MTTIFRPKSIIVELTFCRNSNKVHCVSLIPTDGQGSATDEQALGLNHPVQCDLAKA